MSEEESLVLFTQLTWPVFTFSSFKKYTPNLQEIKLHSCNRWEISSLIPSEAASAGGRSICDAFEIKSSYEMLSG